MTSAVWLVRFGTYDLSGIVADFSDTTVTALDSISTFPGVSGGLDNYGSSESPKPPASISATLMIVGTSALDFQLKLDALDKALRKGRERLWYAPYNTTDKAQWRWTWAKVTKADRPHAVADQLVMQRPITFSLLDPFWYNNPNVWYFDDGNFFDTGLVFGGAAAQNIANGTTLTITNLGDAPALPVLTVTATASIDSLVVQRVDAAGNVFEQWSYALQLPAGSKLIVDCAAYRVTYDGPYVAGAGYAAFTPASGQRPFMALLPGDNTIKITGTFGGAATLTVDFFHAWH